MAGSRILVALGLTMAALAASPSAANIMGEDSLPRVEDPICPGVMGISTQAALQIIDRIRYNAKRMHLRMADPEKCSPNLLVAFVDNGQKSVTQLLHSQPQLFLSLSMPQRRALVNDEGPVRAWNRIATRTQDGMWVAPQENLQQIPEARTFASHSKIHVATRQDILSTVVIFDGQKVKGLTTTQLADYATMRSLAADYSAYADRKNSILSLFEDSAGRPNELTSTDLLFLHNLYSGIANLPRTMKNRTIEHELEQNADK